MVKKRKKSNPKPTKKPLALWRKVNAQFVFFLIMVFSVFSIIFETGLIRHFGVKTTGIIVNSKNFTYGHMSKEYTYSYNFPLGGFVFHGDSHSKEYDIDDTIDILYVPYWPWFHEPAYRAPSRD